MCVRTAANGDVNIELPHLSVSVRAPSVKEERVLSEGGGC